MGHVYFVQVISSGDIKIGYSTNIRSRISTLQTSIPEKIKLLGYISGDLGKEKELHKKFRILRLRGEWFRCDSSIIDFLNENNEMMLQTNLGVYVELCEDGIHTIIYGKM
jgi:hypothetical protein